MPERVSQFVQNLLQERERFLIENEDAAVNAYGEVTGFGGGDAEHDETAVLLLDKLDQARRQRIDFQRRLSNTETFAPPSQFEQVQLGHRVEVFFASDESDNSFVSIVSPLSLQVLSDLRNDNGQKIFDGDQEILVSEESPVGKAILNHKPGETTNVIIEEEGRANRSIEVKIGKITLAPIFG